MLIQAIIAIVVGTLLSGGAFLFARKRVAGSVGAERDEFMGKIKEAQQRVEGLLQYSRAYFSQAQNTEISGKVESAQATLTREREGLKALEQKLEKAQKGVEEKEAIQQQTKSSKEEDEKKLGELLGGFDKIEQEAVGLERELAESLKNLDNILKEVKATDDQKAVLQELQSALTDAGARLRELLMEHGTVKERLEMLNQQHRDLEEEYTRLVEQQLGE